MKRLFIIPVLLFSIVCNGQSKKIDFKAGPKYDHPGRFKEFSFFNDSTGIASVALRKLEEINIIRFDPITLNQISEKSFEATDRTEYFRHETFVKMAGNYYWIHSDYDKANDKEVLAYDKINIVTGTVEESNHKMLETSRVVSFSGKYDFYYDQSVRKMLVVYRSFPEIRDDKKSYSKIGILVLDEKMNKIFGGEYTMPHTEAMMANCDYGIDGNANAYMLNKVYDSDSKEGRDSKTGMAGYYLEVLKFSKDRKDFITMSMDNMSSFLRGITLKESPQNKMFITAPYSKNSLGSVTDGVFVATITDENKIRKYGDGFFKIPLDEVKKYESKKIINKIEGNSDYEVPFLPIADRLLESDGGLLITFEESYTIETKGTPMSSGYSQPVISTYKENIYALKINPSGKLDWARKIPKRQQNGNTDGTMGFKLIPDPTGYYFLYFDNYQNIAIKDNEVPETYKNGHNGKIFLSKITQSGQLSKEIQYFADDEDQMKFAPPAFIKINNNQFIESMRRKGNNTPLLITIK